VYTFFETSGTFLKIQYGYSITFLNDIDDSCL